MKKTVNYNGKLLSLKLLNAVFVLVVFGIFYMPNVAGRDYLGIFILFSSVFIIILYGKFFINRQAILILVFITYTIFVDFASNFVYPTSIAFLLRTIVYASVPIIAFLLGSFFSNWINEKLVNKAILIIGFIQALVGIAQVYNKTFRELILKYFTNYEKYSYTFEIWGTGRAVGTIGNPNTFGVFMVIFVLFALTLLFFRRGNGKLYNLILIITILISVYAIILSQSRTAFILLIMSTIILVFFSRKRIILRLSILFTLLIIFMIIYHHDPFLSKRFGAENVSTLGGRIHVWKAIIENYLSPFTAYNLIGYGFYYVRDIGNAIDNFYLQLILQYGLIGLVLYINMFIYSIKAFLRRINVSEYGKFIVLTIIVILISDFTGAISMSVDIFTFYFLILGYYFKK